MKVVRVQHISVNCHDNLEATRSFYSDLFEFPNQQNYMARDREPGNANAWRLTTRGVEVERSMRAQR